MIFKTINSSVDETRKTLALFNKDWNTYKRNWQNANGVFGKIGSVFTPANAITKSDIEAIKAYNSQIDSCVTSQTAFNRTMLNASPAAQNLVASYNGGKVSAQGMATAQNAAKASTIGLTIAQTALNAAIGMGIGLLISLVVKGIDKLVHANEEAIEKAEELRRKYEEFKSTNESNVTTLNGLKKEFEELSKGVSQYGDNISLTTEQYEKYKEIIQQIVGMSPSLAEGYSTENGYIADKNGLLERAIELQEKEYRNELRKITNLDNLKTSMSGYIAEYKEAFNGGLVTDDMSAISTTTATDFSNALYDVFNLGGSGKHNYDNTEKIARKIIESLGIEDVNSEIQKFINKNGNFESSWFFKTYADTIAENIGVITDSLSADIVGLDDTVFDQNIEKVDSAAQSYLDMKDAISMANESIQRDLGYIAEYADGYSNLSTEQQKFVNEFLKGYDISDIMSESNNPFDQGWKFDENKMASVKSQITKFVEALSQDETTKSALADLYAIPTDEQSISEFVEQFRNALEIIKAYCQENGIEIPIAITDSEQTINNLEAQYQRAVDFAKDKFDGYDPTTFFKEHSINTQEEIDAWQEIAQEARDAAEAEEEYLNQTQRESPNLFNHLTTSQESLDKFQSSIKSAADAYTTLLSGNYSTSELLSSIQTINQAVTDMGGSLDWEFIANQSQMDSLELLGGAIEHISQEYAESILSGAGIDVNSEFGQMLAKMVQEAYEAEAEFAGMNAQLDNLQSSYQTLTGILESYNETGYISLDNLQSLLTADENLIAMLEVENGQLTINQEAYENLVAAQLMEFKAKLNDAAAAEIETLAKNKAEEATNKNADASNDAVEKLDAETAAFNRNTSAAISNAIAKAEESGVSEEEIQGVLDKYNEVWNATVNNFSGDFDGFMGGGASAAKAGSAAADAYVDAFEKELKQLQTLRDQGKITEKEYLDYLRKLYQKFFRDKKKYAEQYAKYEHEYLQGMKSLYESALSGITSILDKQISAYGDAKNAAVDALEAERDAAIEAKEAEKERLEEKIDLIDKEISQKEKEIDGINDEIDAIREANDERQRQLDLQKAQYELERMQNQKTILQYSSDKGMHYVTDTSGVRDAKDAVDDAKTEIEIANKEKEIKLIEKEIELLEERKDAINEQIDFLDKQIEQINKQYDKLIADTEKYWDDLIKGMEDYKSRWEELAEIEEQAKIVETLRSLGIETGDILNMSEEAFARFKDEYISILADIYSGNDSMLSALSDTTGRSVDEMGSYITATQGYIDSLSGIGGSLNPVAEAIGNVDENMGSLSSAASDANTNLTETASTTSEVASNVGSIAEGLGQIPDSQNITNLSGAFDTLAESIGKVAQALGLDSGTDINTLFQTISKLNTVTLGNECEGIIGQFTLLKNAVTDVINTIGLTGEQTVGSLIQAISELNTITLGESIITQFNNLKAAIDSVSSAISGGSGSSDGEGASGGESISGTFKGGKQAKKGFEGGGGNSLTGAIESIGDTASEVIGEPDAEGDGTVIGKFGSLETAVNDVTAAIGGGASENGEGQGEKGSDNLSDSITNLGTTTKETLGEPDGEGVIGRFRKFRDVIGEADEHVHNIYTGLNDINNTTVECTIKINIEKTESIPNYASGTALGAMNLESAEYNAKYEGNAHVSGTANVAGNWGVRKPGKSLVGELGQELWVHSADGTFETVGDNGPEWIKTAKGDLIFNHLQTKELLDKGNIVKTGIAYANGTAQYSDGTTIMPDGSTLRPLQPGDKGWDLLQKFQPLVDKILSGEETIVSNAMYEGQRQFEKWTNEITNNTAINNVVNNRNMQPIVNHINVTCPGVTEQQVAERLGNVIGQELNKQFNGFSLYTDQMSRRR